MRPMISYYGGKQRMAPKIIPFIPPHLVYCEPFTGGAAVFYAKPRPNDKSSNYREVLNDLNGDLVNLYRVAKSHPASFSDQLQAIPFSLAMFKGSIKKQQSAQDRALAFFIHNQQSFGYLRGNAWRRSTTGPNDANTFASKVTQMKDCADRLQSVYIDSQDAVKCIQAWDSPHTFFYIDPPYLGTSLGGMGQWGPQDLLRLTNCLNMTKGSFIVSGYNNHGRHLRGAIDREFQADCSMANASRTTERARTEVIWMRGPAAPVKGQMIAYLKKQTCFTGPLLGPCPLPLGRKTS